MKGFNHSSSTVCPKCAAFRNPADDICPSCGVIYAKVRRSPDTAIPGAEGGADLPAGDTVLSVTFWMRGAFLIVLAFYTFRLLSHPIASNYVGETFLHLVNLPFHEAGHLFFQPFGRFLNVAGGTLLQLIVPAAVAVSFFRRRDRFAAGIGLWWLGESMADVAPYADDARAGQLMLLGGVTGSEVEDYHDWEVMLGKLGILSWDHAIGRFFFVAGGMVMIAAIIYGAVSAYRSAKAGEASISSVS